MKIKLVCNVKECIYARLFLYIITSINNVTTSKTYSCGIDNKAFDTSSCHERNSLSVLVINVFNFFIKL